LRAVLAAHLTETPRPLDELCPDTPPHVSAAIMKALAKSPDGRVATAAEFRDALDSPHAYGRARPRMRRRRVISAAAALLAVAVGGALISRDGGDDAALDSNLVAVAPFDVLGSDLRLWREGLVDLLSRNLDGAGALRTVAPTVVVRRWRGRADVPSATALARRSGARLAVFGTLTRSGTDSVRLAASLLDAGTGRVLTEIELRDVESHTDRLADSVTVAVLRELGRSRPVRAVRGAGVGSRSVPALKAYLQAEQFYRRGGWDSAVAYSERAIALDSTMALAWRRAALARTWRTSKVDSLANRYALRAGALNRGLPPRDSLLIVADSIRGALEAIQIWLADTTHLVTVRRHAATLEELVRRYPDDPEGWYELGDARLHIGSLFGVNPGKALEAFERSIALDSAFAPAYPHTIELGVALRGMAAIRRYAANYRALSPLDTAAWLAAVALDPAADPRAVRRMLDTVSADALYYAISLLHAWPDSAETVLGMCRRLLSGGNRRGQISAADQAAVCVQSQAYHGRLGEAYRTSARYGLQGPDIDWNDVQMALLGMMPADSAARRFANWLRRDLNYAFRALPWWVSRGDTAAISAVVRLADSIARSSPPTVQSVRFAPSAAQAARGYLALTRGDTTEAMRRLPALPDSARCCLHEELLAARLLQKRGRHHEAAQLLLARETPEPMVVAVLWMLERGRVFKRLGDRERAISSYRFVADVWAHADPELQPYVAEARRALEELRAAGRQRARPSPHQK
jgi:eukaryotic-like serine/threonine-protein kinase